MKERIKQIIENERLTPSRFADKLDINRNVISHILNGRNNPSLDVVSKILLEINYINPEWLINGIGNMYKDDFDISTLPQEHDLFSENEPNATVASEKVVQPHDTKLTTGTDGCKVVENKIINDISIKDKKISQIIIYYDDNTFETFIPTLKKV